MALTWQLPDGRVVIPSTVVSTATPSIVADQAAGAQVETFNISAQGTFTGLTIDPNNLPDSLQDQLRGTLQSSVPESYRLTDEPVRFTNPVESQPGTGLISVDVSIDAAEILDQNTIDDIQTTAANKEPDVAKTDLAGNPKFSVVSVSVQPSLIISKLPGSGKIEVVEQ